MKNREATEKFQLGQRLYEEKRFSEALDVFNELGDAFPGTKNILYPRARCLYKLNRLDEARYVAELLIDRFADSRAEELLLRIKEKQAPPPTFDAASLGQPQMPQGQAPQAPSDMPPQVPLDPAAGAGGVADPLGLEPAGQVADPLGLGSPGEAADPLGLEGASPIADILGEDAVSPAYGANDSVFGSQQQGAAPPPPSLEPESNVKKYVLWGVGGVILVALIALPVFFGRGKGGPAEAPEQAATPAEGQAGVPAEGQGEEALEEFAITWTTYHETMGDYWDRYGDYDSSAPPTLLYFSSPGSEDCEKMDKRVFDDPSIALLMVGWDFVRVDPEQEPDIAAEYGVESVPTVVVVDTDGYEVERQVGYKSATKFYEAISRHDLRPVESIEEPGLPVASLVLFLALLFVPPFPSLYVALLVGGKLPHNELGKDAAHIATTIFISYLLLLIPCIGPFVSIYFIFTRYEMGFVDALIYIGVLTAVELIFAFLLALSLGIPFEVFLRLLSLYYSL